MKPEIYTQDGKLLQTMKVEGLYHYHRLGVIDCPHCGCNTGYKDYNAWYRYIREIVLQDRLNKPGTFIMISQCPECKEPSWIHAELWTCGETMKRLEIFGWEKVMDEHYNRVAGGIENWEQSECKKCENLKTPPDDFKSMAYSPYIVCKAGMSGPVRKTCLFVDEENRFGYKDHKVEESKFIPCKGEVHKARWEND